jgi:molybdate transport system substrate-binding protein
MPVYHGALRITRVLDSLGDFVALLRTPPPRGRRSAFLALAAVLFSAGCAAPTTPHRLSIAAAADLQFALDDISRVFRQAHPAVDVAVTYGSSGNFYSEIRNQAPFDVFLSADIEYPRKLAQEGLADARSMFTYGVGRIVVWAPRQSPLDLARLQIHALEADSVKHIAVANPQHAPYGRAAVAAMQSLGVYSRVQSKLVLGENISQTLQFVQSGAAEVGIVALALALAPSTRVQGQYWEIPIRTNGADTYPKLEQAGVVLSHAKNVAAAREFCAYLQNGTARGRLKEYGFYLPEQ